MCALVKTPKFVSSLLSGYIWHLSREKKELYLTFDDGPIPKITPWVLDQLNMYNAKATFFCIGENTKKNSKIFDRILKEGHTIGNHTFNHLNGIKTETKLYLENVKKTNKLFIERNSTHFSNNEALFRPPYGKILPKQAKALRSKGYKIVLWDVLSKDYDSKISGDTCFKNVIDNTQNGSIIVFHDSVKAFDRLKYTLPKVLEYYNSKGFVFKIIKDIVALN